MGSFFGQFHSVPAAFLGRCSTSGTANILRSPVQFGFTYTASPIAYLGLSTGNLTMYGTYCLVSQTSLWKLSAILHDPCNCVPAKPAPCRQHQVLLGGSQAVLYHDSVYNNTFLHSPLPAGSPGTSFCSGSSSSGTWSSLSSTISPHVSAFSLVMLLSARMTAIF